VWRGRRTAARWDDARIRTTRDIAARRYVARVFAISERGALVDAGETSKSRSATSCRPGAPAGDWPGPRSGDAADVRDAGICGGRRERGAPPDGCLRRQSGGAIATTGCERHPAGRAPAARRRDSLASPRAAPAGRRRDRAGAGRGLVHRQFAPGTRAGVPLAIVDRRATGGRRGASCPGRRCPAWLVIPGSSWSAARAGNAAQHGGAAGGGRQSPTAAPRTD